MIIKFRFCSNFVHSYIFLFGGAILGYDCLCGLEVRVLGYRSRGPGSILGATRFSENWVRNGVHLTSWVQLRIYLKEKAVVPVQKTEIRVPPRWPRNTLLSAQVVTNFADKRWPLIILGLCHIQTKLCFQNDKFVPCYCCMTVSIYRFL
jgi:hypothetical protein